jgi:hypothetical protein
VKTCLIFGHDGLDIDVMMNLRSLYRSLGFKVAYGTRITRVDLLVVQRVPARRLNVHASQPVHVWDYVGTPIADVTSELAGRANATIFTSSDASREALLEIVPSAAPNLHTCLPPVDTRIWVAPPTDLKYDAVHIGNFKPSYKQADDPLTAEFLDRLRRLRADIWGAGWSNMPDVKLHGVATQREVSSIYAASQIALGQMYPFQRSTTLSGRFWHAPLNGCVLVSEPSVYSDTVPGVVTRESAATQWDRETLRKVSREYWDDAFASTRERVIEAVQPSRGRRDLMRFGAMLTGSAARDWARNRR